MSIKITDNSHTQSVEVTVVKTTSRSKS